jgi:hypothetical protein
MLSFLAASGAAQVKEPPEQRTGERTEAPAQPADAVQPATEALGKAQEAEQLDRVLKERIGADEDARASQERVNQIDDETQRLLAEYRRALAETESHTAYAKQLEVQIGSQVDEIASVQQQLQEIETTSRAVTPLMQRMLDTLGQFVALDVPFLLDEREKRVAALEEMMTRADVTVSEKYRRIVEAYQVEMDYGRTIEAYEGKLGKAEDARTVQFLRVGRVSLLYQTLDGRETGYWDADDKSWVVDDAYRHGFKEGIAVAKKLRAPEMLIVPVPAPEEAGS